MTRSMTTVERYIELRSRLEELEAMAEHVPPPYLAERLVEIVGKHMECIGSPVELGGIRERVKTLEIPAPPGLPYPPPTLDAARTIEIPQGAPVEETPNEELLREGYEEINERQEPEEPPDDGPVEEPEASAEPEKTCTKCGKSKPLSEFYKNQGKCKPCYIERQRELGHRKKAPSASESQATEVAASPKADGEVEKKPERLCARRRLCLAYPEKQRPAEPRPGSIYCSGCLEALGKSVLPSTVAPLPEKKQEPDPEEAPARFCANGDKCVAYPQLDEPTRLHPSNLDDVCFPCQEQRRKFGRTGPGAGKMIVRHSVASEAIREVTA